MGPSGYSGRPLHRKLGLRDGQVVCVIDAPHTYAAFFEGGLPALELTADPERHCDVAHLFATELAVLAVQLPRLQRAVAPAGAIWVSWPKKRARVPTDIDEDAVRAAALPLGLVDVKVCAVDETWSGLKLVIRRELRHSTA
jgi:hypothetical protein